MNSMSRGLRLKQNGVGERQAEGDGRTATERGRQGCLQLRKGPQVSAGAPRCGHTGKAMAGQTLSKGQERRRDIRQKEGTQGTRRRKRAFTRQKPRPGRGVPSEGRGGSGGRKPPAALGPPSQGSRTGHCPGCPPEPGPLAPVCHRPQPEARPGKAWGQHCRDPEWRPPSSTGSRAVTALPAQRQGPSRTRPGLRGGLTSGRWRG